MSVQPERATITMYLRSPQLWWVYLGIRSNPAISRLIAGFDSAVFFEDPMQLQPVPSRQQLKCRYLLVCWDGLTDERPIEDARRALGPNVTLTLLVVGDYPSDLARRHDIQSLYAEGPLAFGEPSSSLDVSTSLALLRTRLKGVLKPVKNILQDRAHMASGIGMLCGKKRVVFCGSFGLARGLIGMLCNRYAIDTRLFADCDFYDEDPNPSLMDYRSHLRNDGIFLAGLYDERKINSLFFLSAAHLLGRACFLEKLRDDGMRVYANQFGAGKYVDVYSTPFYAQHVFLDFGSVVGTGNYPRLADLRYFGKTTVVVNLENDIETLLTMARGGMLESLFEAEWDLKAPRLRQLMQ